MWHLKWDTNNSTVLEEEGPQGEPQLLCEAQHAGDVTDMNVSTLFDHLMKVHLCYT